MYNIHKQIFENRGVHMITTLHIKNIGIISDVTVDFQQGFNVLTGETGAGKSLIIDALSIISGGRFSKEMIRTGEEVSFIEANLYLPHHPEAIEGNIIITREVHGNGRNACKINGRLVTVNELKHFMKEIIDIHGQNDSQRLLQETEHIHFLDAYAGEALQGYLQTYKEHYTQYKQLQKELKENYGDEREKQRRMDLLQYQLSELENAHLKVGEEEMLEEKRRKYLNAEKITENLTIVDKNLSENAIDAINMAVRALEKLEGIEEQYGEKSLALKTIYYDIQELARDISSMHEELYFDEEERNQVEQRLDLIYGLKRKYGNTIEEMLSYKEQLEKEWDILAHVEEHNQKLKEQIQTIETKMQTLGETIRTIRKEKAQKLTQGIQKELEELEMKHASMKIAVEPSEDHYAENGIDQVAFLIRTNIGDEYKKLAKIASGGEISRIMLAIKTVLAEVDNTPIMIFDEIDTGISGKAAKTVSEKLKKIAMTNHQILCITHSASIAAKGDYNYYIYKTVQNNVTKTNIKRLEEKEIIQEIARIANGDITEIALEHARELRKIS